MNKNQYYYQSIGNQNKQTSTNNQKAGISDEIHQRAEPQIKTDQQFFNTLQHYTPLCYSGHGSPLLMVNKKWYFNLFCVIIINAVFIFVIILFQKSANQGVRPMSEESVMKFTFVNIALIVTMNIAYVLTQFLNPGIRNPSTIQLQQYQENGKLFCERCNNYRTQKMQHCSECKVCIEGLDHHCGFFSKCIGGCQKFAFYSFVCISFLGFFSLIISMAANIGL